MGAGRLKVNPLCNLCVGDTPLIFQVSYERLKPKVHHTLSVTLSYIQVILLSDVRFIRIHIPNNCHMQS